MTMSLIKKCVAIVLLGCSSFAFAAGETAGKIETILIYQGHTGLLIKLSNMINPDACARIDWFILPKTHVYYKEIYSLLLATNYADKSITIDVAGCDQGFPVITNVMSQKY